MSQPQVETPTHSPTHATSSQSNVLFSADGQKSSDCEPRGNDRGAGADGETTYITTLMRNANIPIIVAVIAAIVPIIVAAIVAIVAITAMIDDSGMATLQCNFSPAAVRWRSS